MGRHSISLTARRERAAKALTQPTVVYAGLPIAKPGGQDQCYPFRPHPHYHWLTGFDRPGSAIAFDPNGGWTHFSPPVSQLEKVWDGDVELPDEVKPIEGLEGWIAARSSVARIGATELADDVSRAADLNLLHARRPKDAAEIDLVRDAVAATAAGHRIAAELVASGNVTERRIQIELEAEFARNGATSVGYASIVGVGSNSAVFHFTPGHRPLRRGEHVLVDAGAEVDFYTADVTRTYGTEGPMAEVYAIVNDALDRAIATMAIGVEWHDIHRVAAQTLAEGIVQLGFAKATADDLIESEAIALFFPHGVGHMVGLGVRDAGGSLPGRDRPSRCCGVNVRCDFPLQEGYLMTVEPGLYFIPGLLRDSTHRERYAHLLDWHRLEPFIGLGGVRLEDNLLVGREGIENLTASIPR